VPGDRPTEFATKGATNRALVTYKKVK
jgi:hypothetical protein